MITEQYFQERLKDLKEIKAHLNAFSLFNEKDLFEQSTIRDLRFLSEGCGDREIADTYYPGFTADDFKRLIKELGY